MTKVKEKQFLRKMTHSGVGKLDYQLGEVPISDFLGQTVSLKHTGKIECVNCSRAVKKTFQQGYCYPCFQSLARCDMCLVKPELCHFAKGTCREPEWGEEHCLRDHVVYLANTTGLKVGITRGHHVMQRWGDQGAVEAIEFAIAPERLIAGKIEVALKDHVADKTNWRGLIKGESGDIDLLEERERLTEVFPEKYRSMLADPEEYEEIHQLEYPVLKYPEKVVSLNFDKTPEIEGELEGIRGQYVFLSGKALNIRKFSGYEVEVEIS